MRFHVHVCSCVELLERPPLEKKDSKQASGQDVKVPILGTSTTNLSGSTKTSGSAPNNTSSLLPQQTSQLPPTPPANANSLPLGDKPKPGVVNEKAQQGVDLLANMMGPTQVSDDVVAIAIVDNSELSSGHSSPASPVPESSPNPTVDLKTGSTSAEVEPPRQSDAQVCGQQTRDKVLNATLVLEKTSSTANSATPGSKSERQPAVERAIPGSAQPESIDTQDVPKVNDVAKHPSKDSVANPVSAKASSTEVFVPKPDVPLISYGFSLANNRSVSCEREAGRAGHKSCVTLLLRCKEYIVSLMYPLSLLIA